MKILIVTTNFPRWPGDFRVPFIYEAAKALHAKENTVRIVTMHNPGAKEHEYMDEMEVFRVRYLPEEKENLQKDAAGIPAAWERGIKNRADLLPYFWYLTGAVGKYAQSFDIIHANWSLAGLAALASKPKHRLPYIITVQGSDVLKTIKKPFIRPFVGLALKKADHVIALSNDLKKTTVQFGVPQEKIAVIPNGININSFPNGSNEERKNQILYVGSLIKRKGVDYLIDAMKILHSKIPDYSLIIVGEGDERENLEKMIRDYGLKDCVRFLGSKPQQEVGSLMRESKVFVLPSLEEGQVVVLVEALASGTPCVGSRVGGIKDVIQNGVGILFEPGNVIQLADAIIDLISNDVMWQTTSEKARQRAITEYDWDILTSKIIEIYHKVLSRKKH